MEPELTFKAMADNTRRRILQLLARHELAVSELVDCLGQPQSTVSRHLKVLRDADLIRDRRDGATVLYDAWTVDRNSHDSPERLAARILEWVAVEEMPRTLRRRLDSVLNRRQERSTDFFSNIGRRWDQMRIEAFGDVFHREALATLLPADWLVADIGTGTGYMLPTLAKMFRKVVAVDPIPSMLDVARGRCRAHRIKNVAFRQGDLSRLPIQEGQVDLSLAILVLHHVSSPPKALDELLRITRPGGRLLIVEQRAHNLKEFHDRMQDRWWGFEPSTLSRAVTAAGFKNVHHRPLAAEPQSPGTMEAPDLFTLVARRPEAAAERGETKGKRNQKRS